MTVWKLDHKGREVLAYPGRVLARTPVAVTLTTRWEHPPVQLEYVVLEPGDRWVERFYADRWYNILEIHAVDGWLKGWYCNVTRPAHITATEVRAEDLALDLWVDPQRRVRMLDEEEFVALPLSAAERAAALAGVGALEGMIAERRGPFALDGGMEMEKPVEVVIGELLRKKGMTLAAAESCTGGLVGHRITDVPGSSDYYLGSVTAYAYAAKERLLGVDRQTLEEHGAVSREVALEMARGVRRVLHADLGVSVTGIAGPSGGTPEKPVGLVYVGLVAPEGEWLEEHIWEGDRRANKAASAEAALKLVQRYLEGHLPHP